MTLGELNILGWADDGWPTILPHIRNHHMSLLQGRHTPLHLAASYGHLVLVRCLVAAGADVAAQNIVRTFGVPIGSAGWARGLRCAYG